VKVEFMANIEELKKRLSKVTSEDGVLLQLPIIGADSDETQRILDMIPVTKDVDGLANFSKFLPAAILAVDKILIYSWVSENLRFSKAAVVGANGNIGRRLVKRLKERALEVEGFDVGDNLDRLVDFDVVVSATGRPGLITAEMLKKGVIAIDLGYPRGDFEFDGVRAKSRLITPVPGGVGPLTIISLFENLGQAAK